MLHAALTDGVPEGVGQAFSSDGDIFTSAASVDWRVAVFHDAFRSFIVVAIDFLEIRGGLDLPLAFRMFFGGGEVIGVVFLKVIHRAVLCVIPNRIDVVVVVAAVQLLVVAGEEAPVDVLIGAVVVAPLLVVVVTRSDVGHVGVDGTFEAPFIAHDVSLQAIAGGSFNVANTVVGGHQTSGATFLDGDLERTDVDFAQRLLRDEAHGAFAADFLFIDAEVLEVAVVAEAGRAIDDVAAEFAGDQRIGGIVFEVTATERRTMGVARRAQPAAVAGEEAFLTDDLAFFGSEFDVIGSSQSRSADPPDVDVLVRAVFIGVGSFVDDIEFRAAEAAVADDLNHFAIGELVHEFGPGLLAGLALERAAGERDIGLIVDASHVLDIVGDGAVVAGFRTLSKRLALIGFLGLSPAKSVDLGFGLLGFRRKETIVIDFQTLEAEAGGHEFFSRAVLLTGAIIDQRESAFFDGLGMREVREVVLTAHLVEVDAVIAREGDLRVEAEFRADVFFRIEAVLDFVAGVTVVLELNANAGIVGDVVIHFSAVIDFVGALVDGDFVSTRIEFIALEAVFVLIIEVVGSDVHEVERDLHFLALARKQDVGLRKGSEDFVRFFDSARSVRSFPVGLDDVLARDGTGVGDLDGDFDQVGARGEGRTSDRRGSDDFL